MKFLCFLSLMLVFTVELHAQGFDYYTHYPNQIESHDTPANLEIRERQEQIEAVKGEMAPEEIQAEMEEVKEFDQVSTEIDWND